MMFRSCSKKFQLQEKRENHEKGKVVRFLTYSILLKLPSSMAQFLGTCVEAIVFNPPYAGRATHTIYFPPAIMPFPPKNIIKYCRKKQVSLNFQAQFWFCKQFFERSGKETLALMLAKFLRTPTAAANWLNVDENSAQWSFLLIFVSQLKVTKLPKMA